MRPMKNVDQYTKRLMRLQKLNRRMNGKWLYEQENNGKDVDKEIERLADVCDEVSGPIVSLLKKIDALQVTLNLFPYKFLCDENLNEFHDCRWSKSVIEEEIIIAEQAIHMLIQNFQNVTFKYCKEHENALCIKFVSQENPEIYGYIEFNSGSISTTVEYPDDGYCESELVLDEDWDCIETIRFSYAFLHKIIHRALQCRDYWMKFEPIRRQLRSE